MDNARIEIEGGPEVPIIDGSALSWALDLHAVRNLATPFPLKYVATPHPPTPPPPAFSSQLGITSACDAPSS